jgi:hypothetical protein
MTTLPNGHVPDPGQFKMGTRGGKSHAALQMVWDRLSTTEYRDAIGFADEAAAAVGVKPDAVRSYVYDLARAGKLERLADSHRFEVAVTRTYKGASEPQTFAAHRWRATFRISA